LKNDFESDRRPSGAPCWPAVGRDDQDTFQNMDMESFLHNSLVGQ
jgi:hypothetical protein